MATEEPVEASAWAPPATRGSWFESALLSAGFGSIAGMLAGVLWGGVGGRVAMRILFLTSDEHVRGLTSDDGFEIGIISGATVFLLLFTGFLGAAAGFVYGGVRMVTAGPRWARALGVGVAVAASGGAGIVHVDGVDFRLIEPLWLAVGLFVVIPGLWGVSVVLLTEWLGRPGVLSRTVPAEIQGIRWGALGWLVLGVITVLGVRDLVDDVSRLT